MPQPRPVYDTLDALAHDLTGHFHLPTLLRRILINATELLDCTSGSLSLFDPTARTYRKEIDLDSGCRAGQEFPLDEGVTGAVAHAGEPVIFRRYGDVTHPHVPREEPRYEAGVIGVPIRLHSELWGAIVVFASAAHPQFDDADARLLERFAAHAAIALSNARLHEEATRRETEAAIAAERERTMLHVHETIGRGLASVLADLAEARDVIVGDEQAATRVERAITRAKATLERGREEVWGLRSAPLRGRSVDETIELELGWLNSTTGLRTTFRRFGPAHDLTPEVAIQLIRIVQECLANVRQHADATSVRVGVVSNADGVTVLVEDDGRGFDPNRPASRRGLGLATLTTRTAQVGGHLRIESTPGWGTRIAADLPRRPSARQYDVAPPLRVVVAHSIPAMRAGLVRMIGEAEPGVCVVGEAGDGDDCVQLASLLQPDVVVAEVGMESAPGMSLVSGLPDITVVGVLRRERSAAQWASDGARGFVSTDVDAATLGRTILAARGDAPFVGSLVAHLAEPTAMVRLTPREEQVRALLEQGLADKQIATRLGIAVKTVEKHVGSVLRKASVHSRVELLARPAVIPHEHPAHDGQGNPL